MASRQWSNQLFLLCKNLSAMKRVVSFFILFLCLMEINAQSGLPGIDKSPMDMCYYPDNYPVLKIRNKVSDPPVARLIYSRPQKEGRTVFGGLVTYGDIWRLGANEATEIEFYEPVTIGGKKVSKGRYSLYALVNPESWTFIINTDTDTWGAFKYDESKYVARINVPVKHPENTVEALSMEFEKTDNGFALIVAWENVQAALPINL
jgi:hypothetical protein